MDREEGEMSDDDNAMLIDDENDTVSKNETNSTVLYKAEKNGVLVKQLGKVDAAKLEERAKRFGLNLTGSRVITQKQIDELYANCGIESGNERHFRFDTLHLNCVDGLTTKEIFEYLEDYKPVSLEWIDDTSCNVVCQDHISVALALLVYSREIRGNELKSMLADTSSHHWREGMPHPKKDLILMRFATNGDKKTAKKKHEKKRFEVYDQDVDLGGKNPWGDLCKSWGVHEHQEIFSRKLQNDELEAEIEESVEVVQLKNKHLAMRLGKRNHDLEEEYSSSDSEWKKRSKAPRMRMHADDEESKQKRKPNLEYSKTAYTDDYAPLSIEVLNAQSDYAPRGTLKLSDKFRSNLKSKNVLKDSLQSRLGTKVVPTEASDDSSDEYSSDDSEHYTMSSVQKVSNKKTSTSSVWSRLENKQNFIAQKDLRQILKTRKQTKSDDLRQRLKKQCNLRIEIDNNY